MGAFIVFMVLSFDDDHAQDPSVRQVTASSTNAQKNLEDYNPFQEQNVFPVSIFSSLD